MLYLDSSALVKRYVREPGTEAVEARFRRGDKIFTSALSYAEVHATLARKRRANELQQAGFTKARNKFIGDWTFSLNVLDLNTETMAALPDLVGQYPLRGSDAAHLATAIRLQDVFQLVPASSEGSSVLEFGVADRELARVASLCGLMVFNPEAYA